jgi:hypothetical protein
VRLHPGHPSDPAKDARDPATPKTAPRQNQGLCKTIGRTDYFDQIIVLFPVPDPCNSRGCLTKPSAETELLASVHAMLGARGFTEGN